ncbi:hypothetical protein LTS18_005511 [Coniosporium uncinatum]|uniref:Uncharacterized protein n=1 Tax=Coniosporium uncinatum TaxID=93489 RepID=A0ACC3DR93_9PEZI|nr:hypothetical protein LTS18_005511 [Coniosporium uncinatum]
MKLTGSCYCHALTYEVNLDSADDARMSLCHRKNCKKAFGTNYGLTAKIPVSSFKYTSSSKKPKEHATDNGSGAVVTRESCDTCGSFILEYGAAAKEHFRYVTYGSPRRPPNSSRQKAEFFCKQRSTWMPEIPDVFHKQEVKQ